MGKATRSVQPDPSIGAPPGMLTAAGDGKPPRVRVIAYTSDKFVEQEVTALETLPQFLDENDVTWINVDGLGDLRTIERIGELLGLHKLALEDIVGGEHRAKAEEYKEHLFVIVRMIEPAPKLEMEQLSLFLGQKFVITFQEREGDCLEPVRARLRNPSGRMRENGASYLAYAIIDAVIDGYLPVLEDLGERIELLEDKILAQPKADIVSEIHEVKRALLSIRRAAWPLRDVINSLLREQGSFISDYTRVYLRDCSDHAIQVIDLVENYREICSDLMNAYLSSISNRLNEVMKVLTIIATIFMPLSFLASLYGMNYNTQKSPLNMPELNWYFGYPFVLLLMLGTTCTMLMYFHSRGWIGRGSSR